MEITTQNKMEKKMAENEKKQEKNACVTIYLHWCQVYVNGVSYYFYPPKKKKKSFLLAARYRTVVVVVVVDVVDLLHVKRENKYKEIMKANT